MWHVYVVFSQHFEFRLSVLEDSIRVRSVPTKIQFVEVKYITDGRTVTMFSSFIQLAILSS